MLFGTKVGACDAEGREGDLFFCSFGLKALHEDLRRAVGWIDAEEIREGLGVYVRFCPCVSAEDYLIRVEDRTDCGDLTDLMNG